MHLENDLVTGDSFSASGAMPATKELSIAIERGLHYLEQHQYPNGEFCCYIAADDPMQQWALPDSVVFSTTVIGSCLLPMASRIAAASILAKVTPYLQYQMHSHGLWSFFSLHHPLRKVIPYDVDSLSFASSFLTAQGSPVPDNKPLLLANRNRKGLFYTWLIFRGKLNTHRTLLRLGLREMGRPISSLLFWWRYESARNDIDLGVNASVLYYLGDIPEAAPAVAALIQVIRENKEGDCDKWYRNPFTIYYLIARAFHRGVRSLAPAVNDIVTRVLATTQANGQLGTGVQDTALGISILHYLGQPVAAWAPAVQYLLAQQGRHGEWPRWLFYYGGPKLRQGWGSEELCTALCLEALACYETALQASL